MSCEEYRFGLAGDDPAARTAIERHAEGCAACAEWLIEEDRLDREIQVWKDASRSPAASLEHRIARALDEDAAAKVIPFRRATPIVRLGVAAAAAATLVFAVWIGRGQLESPPDAASPIEAALAAADGARETYARAIVALELQAVPILARVSDPAFGARDASLILRYRDQLQHLDSVIAEVQGFLEENPGHAGGHTVLLAAYQDKQSVLDELLGLSLGDPS